MTPPKDIEVGDNLGCILMVLIVAACVVMLSYLGRG